MSESHVRRSFDTIRPRLRLEVQFSDQLRSDLWPILFRVVREVMAAPVVGHLAIDLARHLVVERLGGMLSAIRRALELKSQFEIREFRMQDIPPEDPATYDMLCKADSVGVFQVFADRSTYRSVIRSR
jgi:hypothetical protein